MGPAPGGDEDAEGCVGGDERRVECGGDLAQPRLRPELVLHRGLEVGDEEPAASPKTGEDGRIDSPRRAQLGAGPLAEGRHADALEHEILTLAGDGQMDARTVA